MDLARPTLADFGDLSIAEQKVMAACGTSEWVHIAHGRPNGATGENTIRAAAIRYLLLGGCDAQRPDVM